MKKKTKSQKIVFNPSACFVATCLALSFPSLSIASITYNINQSNWLSTKNPRHTSFFNTSHSQTNFQNQKNVNRKIFIPDGAEVTEFTAGNSYVSSSDIGSDDTYWVIKDLGHLKTKDMLLDGLGTTLYILGEEGSTLTGFTANGSLVFWGKALTIDNVQKITINGLIGGENQNCNASISGGHFSQTLNSLEGNTQVLNGYAMEVTNGVFNIDVDRYDLNRNVSKHPLVQRPKSAFVLMNEGKHTELDFKASIGHFINNANDNADLVGGGGIVNFTIDDMYVSGFRQLVNGSFNCDTAQFHTSNFRMENEGNFVAIEGTTITASKEGTVMDLAAVFDKNFFIGGTWSFGLIPMGGEDATQLCERAGTVAMGSDTVIEAQRIEIAKREDVNQGNLSDISYNDKKAVINLFSSQFRAEGINGDGISGHIIADFDVYMSSKVDIKGKGLSLIGDFSLKNTPSANADPVEITEQMLDLNLQNHSTFTGSIHTPSDNSQENLNLSSLKLTDSIWNVADTSNLSELVLGRNSSIDLTFQPNSTNSKTHHVTTNNFSTDIGRLIFNVDATNQSNTNKLIVNGEASGRFNAQLNVVNGDQLTYGTSWVISQQSGTLTLDTLTYQPGAAVPYKLVFLEDQTDGQGETTSTGNTGKWYLVRPTTNPDQSGQEGNTQKPDPEKPNPDQSGQTKPPVTEEVDQVLSLGSSITQALGMLSETEDLRMRMGDVRHGDTDGLWVRTYSRKDSAHGSFGNGFEQDVHGFHIGADHVIRSNDNASWLVGGAFHYGKSDIEGAAEAGGGDADIDQYTFKAYATYMKDNGAFADIVLHTGYYDTTLTGKDNTGLGSFKGDYSNWGYGVSAEVGHRFDLSNIANRWYIEPTAQLTWFHAEGKNFKTSTGLEINQGDADFITGRLGAAVGKVFALGAADDPMSSYFSVAMKGGMLYQFDGDQTITAHGTDGATVVCADAMDMKGARAYYGINADWKIDDTWRVYGQISREEGSGYTKDYDASIGVRYAF